METEQSPPAKLPRLSEDDEEEVLKALEIQLEVHDENRKAVQGKINEVHHRVIEDINRLEGIANEKLETKYSSYINKLLELLNELRENNTINTFQKVNNELFSLCSHEITESKEFNPDFRAMYVANKGNFNRPLLPETSNAPPASSDTTGDDESTWDSDKLAEGCKRLIDILEKGIEILDEEKRTKQDKCHNSHEIVRTVIDDIEEEINKELEEEYTHEDKRLQEVLNELRANRTPSALQKAKAELLVERSYEVTEQVEELNNCIIDSITDFDLETNTVFNARWIKLKAPTNVCVTRVDGGRVSVKFAFLNPDEERVLSDYETKDAIMHKCLLSYHTSSSSEKVHKEYPLTKDGGDQSFSFTPPALYAGVTYEVRVKTVTCAEESEWSDATEFKSSFKECCGWGECPVRPKEKERKYQVHKENPRIVSNIKVGGCTIIGSTFIPNNTITSWNIKILNSNSDNGEYIYVGVAPADINQHIRDNHNKCGWYFNCYDSMISSGPPHNYRRVLFGPRMPKGGYVREGDSVGVAMDTIKGELSFVLSGMNLGVAFEGIPLDKPLVPCVILWNKGDSVGLDFSGVKETEVDDFIHTPFDIKIYNVTWDSITLTWKGVKGTSTYQVEVDGSKSWDTSTTNTFTKTRLLPETEHSFRVRTVRGSLASEWSDVVKGRTLKAPEFSGCVWKECPDDADNSRKYSVDWRNPRIARNTSGNGNCTIMGNTPIPLNTVTSWSIKALKSRNNDGCEICVGIAPFDINQIKRDNSVRCGWYFNCYRSVLYSGPPHNYQGKEYGPRKGYGQYFHTGDSIGVVVGTTKGELLFVLNGMNLGLAYDGIPLDKPLVPCVTLYLCDDSIELIL